MDHPKETAANGTFSKILVARQEKVVFCCCSDTGESVISSLIHMKDIHDIHIYNSLHIFFHIMEPPHVHAAGYPHCPNIPKKKPRKAVNPKKLQLPEVALRPGDPSITRENQNNNWGCKLSTSLSTEIFMR